MTEKRQVNIRKTLNNIGIKNLVPGTMVYRGTSKEPFQINFYCYNGDKVVSETFSDMESFIDYESSNELTKDMTCWINITGINHLAEMSNTGDYFGISKLVMEHIVNISNHSVNILEPDYIFNSVQMVHFKSNKVINENISIYMKEKLIITFQERPGDVFDGIRQRIENAEGIVRTKGPEYLYFALFDALADSYLDVIRKLEADVESLEEKITRLEKINVKDIHEIRKILMIIRFSASPVERFMQTLLGEKEFLGSVGKLYMESLDSHLKEVMNEQALQKETVDSLFENYVLNNSNRMNEIMTVLTIFSAIFIPLSFVAGVFGMNFLNIPGLSNKFSFLYFLIGCGVSAGGMLLFFKLKKWF
jgi:magnesium transporter